MGLPRHEAPTSTDTPPRDEYARADDTATLPPPTDTPESAAATADDPPAVSAAENPGNEEGALPPEVDRALKDGDYGRAIVLIEERLRADEPAHRVPMVLALARAYRAEGRHTEAIAVLAVVIEEARSQDEAADSLALLATSYSDGVAAPRTLRRYLAIRPSGARRALAHGQSVGRPKRVGAGRGAAHGHRPGGAVILAARRDAGRVGVGAPETRRRGRRRAGLR